MKKTRRFTGPELAGCIALGCMLMLVLLPAVAQTALDPQHRASCQNNLKQMSLVCKMFANESRGNYFPPRFTDYKDDYKPEARYWGVMDYNPVYPEYLTDSSILTCPADKTKPENVDMRYHLHGIHPTWADAPKSPIIRDKAKAMQTANVTQAQAEAMCAPADGSMPQNAQYCYIRYTPASYAYWGRPIHGEWVDTKENCHIIGSIMMGDVSGLADSGKYKPATYANELERIPLNLPDGRAYDIPTLQEGSERFFITDINNPAGASNAQSTIAVIWDDSRVVDGQDAGEFNHAPEGGNVLFMDGHVEFVKYPAQDGSKYWMLSDVAMNDGLLAFP